MVPQLESRGPVSKINVFRPSLLINRRDERAMSPEPPIRQQEEAGIGTALQGPAVMAPTSPLKAIWPSSIPGSAMVDFYRELSSDGGLIVAEETAVAMSALGHVGSPGLYDYEQMFGWTRITEAVHAKGGFIFANLWHAGRAANVAVSGAEPVAPSVDPAYWADTMTRVKGPHGPLKPSPHRAFETEELRGLVELFRGAAINAKAAGFDGAELAAGDGSLMAQFLSEDINRRMDPYGGSTQNRARLLFEVLGALTDVWGPGRVGIRLSLPDGRQASKGSASKTFRYVVDRLRMFDVAYLHVARPAGDGDVVTSIKDLKGVFEGAVMIGPYRTTGPFALGVKDRPDLISFNSVGDRDTFFNEAIDLNELSVA